jgi:hypothetical protein
MGIFITVIGLYISSGCTGYKKEKNPCNAAKQSHSDLSFKSGKG